MSTKRLAGAPYKRVEAELEILVFLVLQACREPLRELAQHRSLVSCRIHTQHEGSFAEVVLEVPILGCMIDLIFTQSRAKVRPNPI